MWRCPPTTQPPSRKVTGMRRNQRLTGRSDTVFWQAVRTFRNPPYTRLSTDNYGQLGIAEVLGPVRSAQRVGHADPERVQLAVEDVRPVTWAVHPAGHHVGGGPVPVGDVLRTRVGVPGRLDPVPWRGALGGVVREVVPLGHVRAVRLGRGGQPAVGVHRPAAR